MTQPPKPRKTDDETTPAKPTANAAADRASKATPDDTGSTATPPERPADLYQPEDDDSELVCFCMHVHEATLKRAIERGAKSAETLSDWTAAGMGCGTCRYDLRDLIEFGEIRRTDG